MDRCPSCDSEIVGRFCQGCGQEQGPLLPGLRLWLRETVDELLLVEARLPRTLKLLVARPGVLTREWAEGRRSRYVAPIRLYLVAAAIFFLIWPLAAEARAAYFEALVRDIVVNALLEAGAEVAIAEAERWQRTMANRIVSALKYLLLLASVPLLAVINRGEWGKDTESLVLQLTFSLHFHAVALFVLALAILLGELWSGFQNTTWAPVLLIAYLALALRGAFATTWRVAVIRSITLYVAFGFAAVVVTLGYAAAAALLWG